MLRLARSRLFFLPLHVSRCIACKINTVRPRLRPLAEEPCCPQTRGVLSNSQGSLQSFLETTRNTTTLKQGIARENLSLLAKLARPKAQCQKLANDMHNISPNDIVVHDSVSHPTQFSALRRALTTAGDLLCCTPLTSSTALMPHRLVSAP